MAVAQRVMNDIDASDRALMLPETSAPAIVHSPNLLQTSNCIAYKWQ
jgi:hypothetical protein